MRDTPPDLAVLALRYAAGDLPTAEMTAFEERLGDDQPAREALSEAIRLSASALGQATPEPSAEARLGVRDRLFPSWFTRLFPRRSYRGHPVAWAGLGGTIAAGVAVLIVALGEATPQPAPTTTFRHIPQPPASLEAVELSLPEGIQAAVPPEEQMPILQPGVPGPRAARPADQQPMPLPAGDRSNG